MVGTFMELHKTKQITWPGFFTNIYNYLQIFILQLIFIIIFLFSYVDKNIDRVSFQESLLELPDT